LRLALFNRLAGLKGRSAQLYQLSRGGVVGHLQRLGPTGRVPQHGAQAWVPRAKEIKRGTDLRREDQQNKGTKQQITFDLLPLHLESLALDLDRLLLEGLALNLV
jgi:hypothetical protein